MIASEQDREEGKVDPPATDRLVQQPAQRNTEHDSKNPILVEDCSEQKTDSDRSPPLRERARSLDPQRIEGRATRQEDEESREGKRKQRDSLERDLKRSNEESQREKESRGFGAERRLSLDKELAAAERLKSGGKKKTVKSMIDDLVRKIEVMVGLIQQNTAVPMKNSIREIQGGIKGLQKNFEKEEREREGKMEALHKQLDRIQSDIESRVEEGKKSETKTKETQTDETQMDTERKEAEEAQMRKKKQNAVSFEEWAEVAEFDWEEEDFRNAYMVVGNPVWQAKTETKVVLIEPDDEEMEKSIQQQYKRAYPILEELLDDCEEVEMTNTTKVRGVERKHVEKIFKVRIGKTEREMWNSLNKIRGKVEGEERVAIHHVKNMTLYHLRTMTETIFRTTTTKVDIYTTARRLEEEKLKRNDKGKDKRETYALIVENQGKTYEQVLNTIKPHLKGRREVDLIEEIRQTRDGRVLIITKKNDEGIGDIQKLLEEKSGQKIMRSGVKGKERVTLNVKGMTSAVEIGDVEEAIRNKVGANSDFKMSQIRPYASYMKAITIEMERELTDLLIREKKLRVGLTMCQIEERKKIKKCSRCWSPSHLIKDCQEEDRRNWCYNCGGQDHQMRNCKNPTNCPDCGEVGHRASTSTCPIYRERVKKDRREKNVEKRENQRVEDEGDVSNTRKRKESLVKTVEVTEEREKDREEEIKKSTEVSKGFTKVERKRNKEKKKERKGNGSGDKDTPTDTSSPEKSPRSLYLKNGD
nr:trichohyalin-like [Onthophagus taurus]